MNEWERKSESSGVWTMPTSAQETPGPEETAPRPAYSDANYVPASEAAAIPKTYHCTPPPEKKTREPRRGVSVLGLIAACLVCAILGGILGGWLPGLLGSGSSAAPETRAESGVVLNVAAPAEGESATAVSTNLVSDGGQKSATELYYELALNQTVAVTTEITTKNVWGRPVSGAVKGSGFLISEDGYILTNHHVIEDAVNGGYQVKVLLGDGSEYDAQVVGYEADNDVAVLKIDASGLSPVTLGDSDRIRVGETVYAVGNPLGELEFTMTSGMISATDREISTSDGSSGVTINMFQIDAAINSGNSGGPIYNSRGEVIGIATAKYASTGVEGLGFAIPINDAVAIARDLISDGYVHGKASIGITVDTVSAAAAQYYGLRQGAIVASVIEGSAAEAAGLQASDIIIELGGKTIASRDDLIRAKRDYQAGDTVELKVFRSGEILTLSLTFDEDVPDEAAETPSAEENQTGREDQGGNGYGFNFGEGFGFDFGEGYDSYEDFFSQLFPFSYR
ncbi:MAG: trypsin-like peptidase domain-containing protein [Oscillospiraceae bacterium]|nr:trypsin-like peptidase domain-containing protein [Oscillospiraceae bacterium]